MTVAGDGPGPLPDVPVASGTAAGRRSAARRRTRIGLGVVALMLFGLVGLAALDQGEDEPVVAGLGDCTGATGVGRALVAPVNRGPAERVDCADPGAAYRVAVRLDTVRASCPSPVYAVRREAGPDAGRTLCLTYAVEDGDCFVETPTAAGRFDCASGPRPEAIRILRVVEGEADAARCTGLEEPGVLAVTVPEPATTFCYVAFADRPGGPVLTA